MPVESTIPDEDVPAGLDRDEDIANAFLTRLQEDGESPSGDGEDKEDGDTEAAEAEDTAEDEDDAPETEEAEEDAEDPAEALATDDAKVVIKVDGKEHRVSVADLKRLYGQEAALTQRAQQVAQARQHYDQRTQLVQGKLDKLISAAEQRAGQFDGVDLAVLAKRPDVTEDQLRAVAKEMREAHADLEYLRGERQEVAKAVTEEDQRRYQEAVRQSAVALSSEGSPYYVKDVKTVYPKLLEHGVKLGVPADVMARETSPVVLKLLHDSLMYREGQEAAKKVRPKAVVKHAKRVAKPGSGEDSKPDLTKARARLRATGSADDAANMFLAKMLSR